MISVDLYKNFRLLSSKNSKRLVCNGINYSMTFLIESLHFTFCFDNQKKKKNTPNMKTKSMTVLPIDNMELFMEIWKRAQRCNQTTL